MRAIRIIAQIVGYAVIALAAVMLSIREPYACAFLLIVGIAELWLSSRLLRPKPSPEEAEQIRRQRKADEEAWRAHVQEEIRKERTVRPAREVPRWPVPPPPERTAAAWESKKAKQQRVANERKQQAAADGVACCPRCGSTSLSVNKKGFGGGKATVGMIGFGLGGAVAGTYGMNKLKITCMNCGYRYKPGKKSRI